MTVRAPILSSRAEKESLGDGLYRAFFAAMCLDEDLGVGIAAADEERDGACVGEAGEGGLEGTAAGAVNVAEVRAGTGIHGADLDEGERGGGEPLLVHWKLKLMTPGISVSVTKLVP